MTPTPDNVSEARLREIQVAIHSGRILALNERQDLDRAFDELLAARTAESPAAPKPKLGTPEYRDMINRFGYEKWPIPDTARELLSARTGTVTVTEEMVQAGAKVLPHVWPGGFEDQEELPLAYRPNDRARAVARKLLTAALAASIPQGEGVTT